MNEWMNEWMNECWSVGRGVLGAECNPPPDVCVRHLCPSIFWSSCINTSYQTHLLHFLHLIPLKTHQVVRLFHQSNSLPFNFSFKNWKKGEIFYKNWLFWSNTRIIDYLTFITTLNGLVFRCFWNLVIHFWDQHCIKSIH